MASKAARLALACLLCLGVIAIIVRVAETLLRH